MTTLCRIAGFCLCFLFMQTVQATAQNPHTTSNNWYTVKAGDTFMSIARAHHTTLDQLQALNPDVQAEYIQPAQRIKVPSAQQPQPQGNYITYIVKRKDTMYSLAKAYNITIEELIAANPQLQESGSKLKKGCVLQIPVKKETASTPGQVQLSDIKVAVVLPFIGSGLEFERSTEFYRGLLLGIENLKNANISVEVSAYNEPGPDADISPLMQTVMANKPHVVVGPVYPSHFDAVTSVASTTTKVAIPFSSKVPQVNKRPEVYVINTPSKYEASLATNLFLSSFNKQSTIVLLQSLDGNKKAFSVELQRRLLSANFKLISLPASYSAEQIKLSMKDTEGQYVVIPDDSSEATLQQMLDKVAQLHQLLPQADISLVGYDAWIPLSEGSYKKAMHACNTYLLTSNYYYPHTMAAQAFQQAYTKWFKTSMVPSLPRMAPLGYDFCHAFLGGLSTYGLQFNTQSPLPNTVANMPKLQTDLRFVSVGKNGGYLNRSMWLVHFKPDMTIIKLSAQ